MVIIRFSRCCCSSCYLHPKVDPRFVIAALKTLSYSLFHFTPLTKSMAVSCFQSTNEPHTHARVLT